MFNSTGIQQIKKTGNVTVANTSRLVELFLTCVCDGGRPLLP